MNKTGKIASYFVFIYHALLPLLAYIAVFVLSPEAGSKTGLILIGWIILLLYQIIKLGFLSKNYKVGLKNLLPLVPILQLSLNTYFSGAEIWFYFLDQAVLEICTMMLALSIVFLFFKDHKNNYAWQDLGIVPFIVVGFIFFGGWAFIKIWYENNIYTTGNLLSIKSVNYLLAFIIAFWINLQLLIRLVKRKVVIPDIFEKQGKWSTAIIIGQIMLWIIVIPLFFELVL